jgi:predicted RNA-binding protein with PUA-like domain
MPARRAASAKAAATTSALAARRCWLFKSEPDCYSIDDLVRDRRTFWDGVRNYQARNMLRDEIQVGDDVFLYHSSADPLAIAGTMRVVRAGYPDHTAFDPASDHYDPQSRREAPTWFMVDVELVRRFPQPVTRAQLQARRELTGMMVLQRGSRLSIQPVTGEEWRIVHELAGICPE